MVLAPSETTGGRRFGRAGQGPAPGKPQPLGGDFAARPEGGAVVQVSPLKPEAPGGGWPPNGADSGFEVKVARPGAGRGGKAGNRA